MLAIEEMKSKRINARYTIKGLCLIRFMVLYIDAPDVGVNVFFGAIHNSKIMNIISIINP
jgi:hypothetical protein